MNVLKENVDGKTEYVVRVNEKEMRFIHASILHVPCDLCAEIFGFNQRVCKEGTLCDLMAEKIQNMLEK